MQLGDLSKNIARSISTAFGVSADPRDIEDQIRGEIDRVGITSFKIDAFLERNYPRLSERMEFELRDLPSIRLMAANDIHAYSPNKLIIFEAVINRVLSTLPSLGTYESISSEKTYDKISPEFSRAWVSFARVPTEEGLIGIISELRKLGVKSPLLENLRGAWEGLYRKRRTHEGVVTRYELLDKGEDAVYILSPAQADAPEVSLSEYRSHEFDVAYDNIIHSRVSVISSVSGSDTRDSLGRNLIVKLSNEGFAFDVEDFANPDIDRLRGFLLRGTDRERVIVFKLGKSFDGKYDEDLMKLLRDDFLGASKGNRVLFLINGKEDTATSAAHTLTPYLERILSGRVDVPSIAVNLKMLNKKQAGELIYGPNVWTNGNVTEVDRAINLIEKEVPMIPSTLIELRSRLSGKRSWKESEDVILDYGIELRIPIDDDVARLRLTSVSLDDDSRWYENRLLKIADRGYGVRMISDLPAFESFALHVAAPKRDFVGGSGSGGGKKIVKSLSGSSDATSFKGFFYPTPGQFNAPDSMIDLLNDNPNGMFDPCVALISSSQYTLSPLLQRLAIPASKPFKIVPR